MTFLWKRSIIFRELVTHTKKSFISNLLKRRYIPYILLIPELFVRPTMACL